MRTLVLDQVDVTTTSGVIIRLTSRMDVTPVGQLYRIFCDGEEVWKKRLPNGHRPRQKQLILIEATLFFQKAKARVAEMP